MIEIARTGTGAAIGVIAGSRLRGSAALRFARCGDRTVLLHSRVEAPMAIVRPFNLPDGRLAVQLVTLGPGLCGGDSIELDVVVEERAHVLLTTTAATRVMAMDPGQQAEQRIRIQAAAGASFEYYPALTIPSPGAALTQVLAVDAAPTARIGVVEPWALGRAARGEYLRFRSLSSRTTLSVDGALVYADVLRLEPAAADLANAGVLDEGRYLAAGFFSCVDGIADTGPAAIAQGANVALGQSRPGLAYFRAIAADAPALGAAIQASIERVAKVWGRPAARLDRFRC